jgi:phosphate transport system permease protein
MTATTAPRPASGPPTLDDLGGDPRRRAAENRVRLVLTAAAATSVVISVAIIYTLFRDAFAFLGSIELSSLTDDIWLPRQGRFGVMSPLLGTMWVTVVATVVAAPIGLAAAVYLSEYANPRVRRIVKPVVEVLASIPSVVVGYFAIRFISPEITQRLFEGSPSKNLMVAGIGVGLLTIPLMTSVSEDALRAVPNSLREASYGLGARKVTTVTRVVIPAAISGLVAGLILSISRAIGETMVVFLAAGGVGARPTSPLDAGTTITAAMASVAKGTDQVKGVGPTFESIFFLGLLLFFMTLGLNLIADRFVRRVRQKY